VRAKSKTWRTRSGRARALPSRDFSTCSRSGQLSIGADGRKRGPHQKPARKQLGLGYFVPGYFSGANIFQNSSHDDSLLSHQDEEQRKDATLPSSRLESLNG
jgi:hypothetical protein